MTDLIGIDTQQVETELQKMVGGRDLGEIFRINHPTYGPGAWVLGQADENIAAGEFVFVTETDGGLTLMDSTEAGSSPKLVGVADVAIASGSYGFVWVGEGEFEAEVDNGVSANTQLTTTGTAGEAGTGGDVINGLRNVDAGVDGTRVTVECPIIMYAGAA